MKNGAEDEICASEASLADAFSNNVVNSEEAQHIISCIVIHQGESTL